MPKILCCGTGLVVPPFVKWMIDARPENVVTVGSRTKENGEKLAAKMNSDRVFPIVLDVSNEADLDAQVAAHDIVVSLVPYTQHALIIKSCLKNKKNFVSTSYVSPQMAEFDGEAKSLGLTVMNEIGFDPGMDHLYALKVIKEVHDQGGSIDSFKSYAGGLPDPKDSGNPFGYKFSWSPRGVLLAARNEAKFKKDGQVVTVPGPKLMTDGPERVNVKPGFSTWGYPNRDSSYYDTRYGMPECKTCLRGSLRYEGNPVFVQALADMGFLNDDARDFLQPGAPAMKWRDLLAKMLDAAGSDNASLEKAVAAKTGLTGSELNRIVSGLRWLGVISDEEAKQVGTYLDCLCENMKVRMMFAEGERDLILLQHEFFASYPDGRRQRKTCTLVKYGEPEPEGPSAMAYLVGVPCAIATQMILDGEITKTGVFAPLTEDLWPILLKRLEEQGISMEEETEDL